MSNTTHDALTRELQIYVRVPAFWKELTKFAKEQAFPRAYVPTLDELIRTLDSIPPVVTSPKLMGLADGLRAGFGLEDQIQTSLAQGLDLPVFDIGIPIGTILSQTIRQSLLVYKGQLDGVTAAKRVAVSAASVAASSALGAGIGSIIFPGVGTLIGGAIGGLFGGWGSQQYIQAEFNRARESYVQGRAWWLQQIDLSRAGKNLHLQRATSTVRKNYLGSLRSTPNFGWDGAQKIQRLVWLFPVRLVDRMTRPFGSRGFVSSLRHSLAQIIAKRNRRAMEAIGKHKHWIEQQHKTALTALSECARRETEAHSQIVIKMVTDLNGRYENLMTAMRRLGRAA